MLDRPQHFDDACEHAVLCVEELVCAAVERERCGKLEHFRQPHVRCDAEESTRPAAVSDAVAVQQSAEW